MAIAETMNVAPDGISTSYRERVINAIAQGNNIGELEKDWSVIVYRYPRVKKAKTAAEKPGLGEKEQVTMTQNR